MFDILTCIKNCCLQPGWAFIKIAAIVKATSFVLCCCAISFYGFCKWIIFHWRFPCSHFMHNFQQVRKVATSKDQGYKSMDQADFFPTLTLPNTACFLCHMMGEKLHPVLCLAFKEIRWWSLFPRQPPTSYLESHYHLNPWFWSSEGQNSYFELGKGLCWGLGVLGFFIE